MEFSLAGRTHPLTIDFLKATNRIPCKVTTLSTVCCNGMSTKSSSKRGDEKRTYVIACLQSLRGHETLGLELRGHSQ